MSLRTAAAVSINAPRTNPVESWMAAARSRRTIAVESPKVVADTPLMDWACPLAAAVESARACRAAAMLSTRAVRSTRVLSGRAEAMSSFLVVAFHFSSGCTPPLSMHCW